MIDIDYISDHTIEFRRTGSDVVIATGRRSFITGWWTFRIARDVEAIGGVQGERVWSGGDDDTGILKTVEVIDTYRVGQ